MGAEPAAEFVAGSSVNRAVPIINSYTGPPEFQRIAVPSPVLTEKELEAGI